MKKLSTKLVILSTLAIAACSSKTAETALSSTISTAQGVDLQREAIVSFKLTDAPNKDLKSVVVDIDHMEVLVAGSSKVGRLILAKGLGPVDLLKLQNGVTLPLQDVVVPNNLQIQQIRLVLKSEGHFAVKGDDSVCELKTPSAQKTGVKIILTNKINFEAGHQYSILVDFDALKSVVIQGNGGCLLKPVLKLKSATKTPVAVIPKEDVKPGDEVVSPVDSTTPVDNTTPVVDSTTPVDTTAPVEDSTVDSSGDAIVTTGPGEVLVTEPIVNDPVNDGWDYTPVIDGIDPTIVNEADLIQLM